EAQGDQYIRACVEMLLEEPWRLPDTETVRLDLFKAFHDVWSVIHLHLGEVDELDDERRSRVGRGLAGLPPLEKRVLLLVSLEGFSFSDTAAILSMDETEVRRL